MQVKEDSKKEKALQWEKTAARVENKHLLLEQMKERERLKEEAYQEYLKEKAAVDDAINRMIDEDRRDVSKKSEKRKTMQEFMEKSMKAKEEQKQRAVEAEAMALEKIRKFQEDAEQREAIIKMKKAEENAAKEVIFAKLNDEELKRRAEKEYIENLRIDLMQEEFEEAARIKAMKEVDKREQ